MKLTKEQKTLKELIETTGIAYNLAGSTYRKALQSCVDHVYIKTEFGACRCAVCGIRLGWWCPETKGPCKYDDEHGENCIHCGEPSERK